METLRYWHNPRCSKSREAMKLLQDRGVTAEVVDYLGQPPSPAGIVTEARRASATLGPPADATP